MRNLLMTALAGSGLFLCTLTATAQDRDRDRGDYNHDGYYQQNRGEHEPVFNRLRSDLDSVAANSVPGSRDRLRIDRARQEVNELQAKIDSGTYDQRDIQQTVRSIDRVMDNNHMPDWARNRMSEDIRRLQTFQFR